MCVEEAKMAFTDISPIPGLPPPSVLEDITTQKWKLKTDEAGKTCMSAGSSSTYKIVVVNVAT